MSADSVAALSRRRRFAPVLHCASAFLLSTYPLSTVVAANEGLLSANVWTIARVFAVGLVLTAVLLIGLRLRVQSLAARAIWVSVFFLALIPYGLVVDALRDLGLAVNRGSPSAAIAYTVVALVIATATARPWRARRTDPIPLLLVAAALLAPNVYTTLSHSVVDDSTKWRDSADQLINSTASLTASAVPSRDIYYLILDGLGREDILKDMYGLDMEPLVGFLRSKDFYVADRAQSNYAQTYLSLAATLNMSYLDQLASVMPDGSRNYGPLDYLIQHNALMALAKKSGYRVVGIGADYMATYRLNAADLCVCEQHGLSELEQAVIAATPGAALPLQRWTYGAHRQKMIESLAAIADTDTHQRMFVFAHLLAAHPPFVFHADGTPRQDYGLFTFADGDRYPGSRRDYTEAYRDQVAFISTRVMALVEALLRRPGPAPVIVVHGDHGPGSMLHWADARASSFEERMPIFSAYYFPDDRAALYPTITPINGARALASRYFGVNLPPVEDRSALSTAARPYDFVPVGR